MQISVTFRRMEPSDALREYAESKLQKIKKYVDAPIEANVVMRVEKFRHIAEVTLNVDRTVINSTIETGDMYSALDGVVDKIERQLKKYKAKSRKHLTNSGHETVRGGQAESPPPVASPSPNIVIEENVFAKPMSVEEAALQLELLNNEFYIFTNVESKSLNIIYRMKDGHYGLIEPQGG